ncbi:MULTISPECIES: Nif11-like leader peptide family natural product precursor [unclassified Coleofasciculus]|uniref:Nif11-like leader peptide family natural product precursor n=1 Tax=unclassified Coleofasciculus TaxID=2692782 RepID=UPI00187EB45B|nr:MULTISPECIES: Nif11-like leader peptide family natural product precursor [unclassified Coleofasciculus]MBE9126989.1 Nif11-like leader peptide family natural product precursor [Coleofasciculus sp. LEGE 07081]MBE9150328.1 Nif11-like leader peptide family natural product precursor [Coleofasciculus sp. LEGE 07092]
MAKDHVAKLFRDAKTNPSLKEELRSAPNVETFVEMARERGYDFTLEEWKEMTGFSVQELEGKLSEIPGI